MLHPQENLVHQVGQGGASALYTASWWWVMELTFRELGKEIKKRQGFPLAAFWHTLLVSQLLHQWSNKHEIIPITLNCGTTQWYQNVINWMNQRSFFFLIWNILKWSLFFFWSWVTLKNTMQSACHKCLVYLTKVQEVGGEEGAPQVKLKLQTFRPQCKKPPLMANTCSPQSVVTFIHFS